MDEKEMWLWLMRLERSEKRNRVMEVVCDREEDFKITT